MTILHKAKTTLLAALCLSLILTGCSRETPEKLIASGKSYLAQRNYPAALIQFKNAVQKAPDNSEARYFLGVALDQEGDAPGAEIELRKAASLGYAPEIVYPALVRALLHQSQFDKALSELALQPSNSPAKAELLALSGNAHLGLGEQEKARAAFMAALVADASNETAKLGMAMLAAFDRDFARATELVDEVLVKAPLSAEALLLKGRLLAAAGKGTEARDAYAKAIEAQPYSFRAYMNLVPILISERDLEGARARVEALRKVAPKAFATFYLDAMVSYAQSDRPRAREAIQQVLRVATDYIPALLLAGAIAHDSGNYAQAEEYLRKVVAAVPKATYPRRLLVSTYLRSGQVDRARAALEGLMQLSPNDPATLLVAGEVALANKESGKAAEYYQKALAFDPGNALMRARLGQAHMAAGETERGIQDLEAASAADASQYQADVALIMLHLGRKEPDKALAAADALAKKQPNNPLSYNLTGLVYLAKKDEANARKSFEHALAVQPSDFLAVQNLASLDMRTGKPEAAKQRLEAFLVKEPKHEQALLALVALLQATRAPASEIEKLIDQAIATNPGSARARVVKVNYLLLQRGDAKGALAAAQQAQAAFPRDLRVVEALGRAQLAAGENDQAIASFGKLVSLAPKSPSALMTQSQAYAVVKDWASARQALQKAIDLQPDLAAARLGLVRVGIESGRFQDARAEAHAIQKRWPTQATGYLAEVDVLTAQKDWSEAERVLRAAIDKTKNPQLVVRLYSLLDGLGRTKEAEALATSWAAQNPNDLLVDAYAAQLSMQRKDYTAAVQWYKSALKTHPDNVVALNNLAWLLGQLHDPSALEYGQKALSLAPNSTSVLDTVGSLYVEQGDLTRGLELLNKAISLGPIPSVRLNLARALIKAGQGDAARQQLEVLAKLPPGTPIRDEAEKLLAAL
jgi:putative PEP-CTERM system TPR-repeat lipoprotein